MNLDTLSSCDTTTIFEVVAANLDIISDEDKGTFILHTNSDDTLGNIIQVNSSGQFLFSDMELNVVYFISYVSGDSLPDGNVNLADPCLSVSFGQPIVYYSTPIIDIGEDLSICGSSVALNAFSDAQSNRVLTQASKAPVKPIAPV